MIMPDQFFTVGHSNHPIGKFIELLRLHAIELVCDVRSTPYSRFNPQFNRETLLGELKKHGIGYIFLGRELGGKPRDPAFPADDKTRFAMLGKSESFRGSASLASRVTRSRVPRRMGKLRQVRFPVGFRR